MSVLDFGLELLAKLVQNTGLTENVSCSPLSVAIALAMVEPGAVGDAQAQLRDLLRIDDYWQGALFATAALIRAGAATKAIAVESHLTDLAARHFVEIS